jgi:hypothetical protein
LLPDQNDKEDDSLIQIDELWVTAQIFNEALSNQAERVQKEARRRLKLWASPNTRSEAERPGNMLVVFGRFQDEKNIEKLPESRHIGAGDSISKICGVQRNDANFFVHWPHKKIIDDQSQPRNDTSLILQASISSGSSVGRLVLGGDAGCEVWENVLNSSKEHGNLKFLDWDVFLCPHHGTYKFFTKKEHEEGRKEARENPEKSSLDILGLGQNGGWLISSSRPIINNNYEDKDPPHIEGIVHYRNRAESLGGSDHFRCLMESPSVEKPQPLVLRLTPRGLQPVDPTPVVAGAAAVKTTRRWGI